MNVNIKKFIKKLSQINKTAMELVENYIEEYGIEDTKELIDYSYKVVQKYGNASGAVAAAMYDAIADLEGVVLPSAEIASLPEYGEVAKTVNGILKTSQNSGEISGGVARLVKRTGQDTMLQNGIRDRAEYAWIPVGETCAFCITLASRGWQPMSKEALKGGHAEHIHSNCDCTYMIRHSSDFDVEGYDPDKYYEEYIHGNEVPYENEKHPKMMSLSKQRINGMRRKLYQENKEDKV